jgi:preprotein translocase subunit SecA
MDYGYLVFRKPWQRRQLSLYKKVVNQANKLEDKFSGLDDKALTDRIKQLHDRGQGIKDIGLLVPDGLALGREVSRRRLGMRHYDEQLMGTLALYHGHIAEMDTGEGKTLMAPVAAFLHQLGHFDRCCHIVTANEYLAARDARWMKPLLDGLGLTIGLIVPGQGQMERTRAYQNDVVYATARDIVFDSLREPLRQRQIEAADALLRPRPESLIEKRYDFAIVDEVDSVLIDQAQSPLSIGDDSGISPQLALYRHADAVAGQLMRGTHYRLMHDDRSVELKDEGKARARQMAGDVLRLLPSGHKWERYVTCALAGRYIYKLDQHYVVVGGKVVLLDESTGRMMPGRQLPDGIHQALEIRNGILPSVEIRGSSQTTFQTFFRKYNKLAGMTGTADMAASEFLIVYNQRVVPIPSHRPSHRKRHADAVYRHLRGKHKALLDEIERVHLLGRPILIGTGSVQESEKIGQMLAEKGLQCEILNAKNHAREAEIIARAGEMSRITVITNMAGRGVDIKLGESVAEKGGMYLFSTDRLPFERLDWQLIGRIGRQGDPGDCKYFLSLNDNLLRYAGKKKICRLRMKTRNRRNESIDSPAAVKLFEKAQKHIAKVSAKQRHQVFQGEKQREKLKEQGLWEDWMDMR